jgi:hypothetical protein
LFRHVLIAHSSPGPPSAPFVKTLHKRGLCLHSRLGRSDGRSKLVSALLEARHSVGNGLRVSEAAGRKRTARRHLIR